MNQNYLFTKIIYSLRFGGLLFFSCLPHFVHSQAKVLVLTDSVKEYQVNQYFLMLKDTIGNLTIKDASNLSYLAHYQAINSKGYRIEYDKGVKQYWLRLEIDNQTDKSEFIFFNPPRFDTLEVYYLVNQQFISRSTGTRTATFSQELFISPLLHLAFPLTQGKNVIYFRIAGNSYLHQYRGLLIGQVWEAYYSYSFYHKMGVLLGISLGALFFLLLFNLIIYSFLRDFLYFIYLLCLLTTILMICNIMLYDYTFGALGLAFIFYYAYIPIGLVAVICNIWFTQYFLKTKNDLQWIHSFLNGLKYLGFLSLLPLFFSQISLSVNALYILSGTFILLAFYLSLLRVWQGFPRAMYFLMANTIYLLGVVLVLLLLNSWLDYKIWMLCIYPFGESIRALIFSIALAERVNILKTEVAQQAQETALAHQQKEFQLQLLKDKIQRDLHDNFGWLITVLVKRLDKMTNTPQAIKPQEIKDLADLARQIIQELRATFWIIKDELITLGDLENKIRDFLWQLNPILEHIKHDFEASYDSQTPISAIQARNLYRVLQEAVHNSLKYSQAQNLQISLKIDNTQHLYLAIEDNGIGFNLQNIDNQANSSHYGLLNMQKRAEEIGGQLSIDSQIQRGTKVSLLLPLA
ncbi:MAG: ATP-binding protein [Microscillaceae bacterium]|jgi:signal transduction histidine kinase|nr:ATP-binding protein [Microscillaceae bacterium]